MANSIIMLTDFPCLYATKFFAVCLPAEQRVLTSFIALGCGFFEAEKNI